MSNIIEINGARALELLAEEVNDRGADFVYKAEERGRDDEGDYADVTCVYVEGGECSCLIARALNRAGLTVDEIASFDGQDFGATPTPMNLVFPPNVQISPQARSVLSRAQAYQDMGDTWGEALDAARQAAKNNYHSDEVV